MTKQKTKEELARLVGFNIKRLRQRKGLSQEEMAEMMSLSKNYISLLENGIKFPSADTLSKLSCVLDTECSVFFVDSTSDAKNISSRITYLIEDSVRRELESLTGDREKEGKPTR